MPRLFGHIGESAGLVLRFARTNARLRLTMLGRTMRRAFQQEGFTRLFAGLTTSMFGDSVMLLVLSMWVKTLTGSNGAAGLTFFWMVVPALFAPVYGMYIDRIKRKPLLVWGNLISALVVLPLLLVADAGDVWII
jgi:hypothetical protein